MLKSLREYLASSLLPKRTTQNWEDLPDIVLVRVFSLLSADDRAKASIVCRNWAEAFKAPSNWFCMIFVFDGHMVTDDHAVCYDDDVDPFPLVVKNQNALEYAKRFGEHLRKGEIKFYNCHIEEHTKMAIDMIISFLHILTLKECCLKSLNIVGWPNVESDAIASRKGEFSNIWHEFLRSQKNLQNFRFAEWELEAAKQLLEITIQASGNTLKNIVFRPIIDDDSLLQMSKFHCGIFCKLPLLQSIEMPYENLSRLILLNLTERSPQLKKIQLCVFRNRYFQVFDSEQAVEFGIKSEDWATAVERCPSLQVEVIGDLPICSVYVPIILTPGMPLTSLTVYMQPKGFGDWTLTQFLFYLQNTFASTLMTFRFYQPFRCETAENLHDQLKSFLLTCVHLKNIHLHINRVTPMSFVEDLYKMQNDKQIDLHKLRLTVFNKKEQSEKKVRKLCKSTEDRSWKNKNWKIKFQNLNRTYVDIYKDDEESEEEEEEADDNEEETENTDEEFVEELLDDEVLEEEEQSSDETGNIDSSESSDEYAYDINLFDEFIND